MTSEVSGLELGHVVNVFYFVPDLPAAVEWYSRLLGRAPDRPMGQLATFAIGTGTLTLHDVDDVNAAAPGAGSVAYWTVSDVDAAAAACVALGATAHRGPKTVFSGDRLCQILDPFGNLLGLVQPPVTSSAAR